MFRQFPKDSGVLNPNLLVLRRISCTLKVYELLEVKRPLWTMTLQTQQSNMVEKYYIGFLSSETINDVVGA